MKILVIGGTGFIGSNMVRFLASEGHEVAVYHRQDSSLKNLNGATYRSITGELMDQEGLADAMANCDGVFNLAACGSTRKKEWGLRQRVNVDAAGLIARTARRFQGLRLVHVSSVAAVGTPLYGEAANEDLPFNRQDDHYAYTKHLGEQVVREQAEKGLDVVIACPGNVVGCHGMKETQRKIFRDIALGKVKAYPPGGVCVTDIDDLVRGLMLCMEKGVTGGRYILGGHNITFKEYFCEIARATKGKAPRVRLPGALLLLMGSVMEITFPILGKEPMITRDTCRMISQNLFYSSRLASQEMGYRVGDLRNAIEKASRAIHAPLN